MKSLELPVRLVKYDDTDSNQRSYSFHIEQALKKLGRRKEEPGCSPTNEDIRNIIIKDLAPNKKLKTLLNYHRVDLIELSAAIYFGRHRQRQITKKAMALNVAKAALKKAKSRARHSNDIGVLRCTLRVQEVANEVRLLTKYAPGLKIENRKQLMGRRQDVGVKLVHHELDRYFSANHPHIPAAQRLGWILKIMSPETPDMVLDKPSEAAVRMRQSRLQKQASPSNRP